MKTPITKLLLGVGALAAIPSIHAQPDYAPAIWRPAYPGHWYTSGNGHKFLVIHDMEGYYASTISYIQQSSTTVSINYCVNGKVDNGSDYPAGEITQMVREAYYSWQARCWNTWMAGTEHEGFASNPAWYTEAMYQASSGLQRHMANGYGIPIDRNHIIAHGEGQNAAWVSWMAANWPQIDATCNTHTDPGIYWDWTHFMDLINSSINPHVSPALGINSDGRQEIFVVNKSGALTHSYQTTINGTWSGFISLGGSFAQNCQPKVLRNNDGRLEVFAINSSGQLSHASESTAGNSSSWSALSTFSSSLTQQVKVGGGTNANGTLDIFVVGTDGALYEMHQTTPGGSWSSWVALGGVWSEDCDIVNGNDLDGRQEVLLIDASGHVNTFYQTAVNGSFGQASLGGTFSQNARMAMARNSDGRLEAFVIGSGGALYHSSQTSANGSWSSWTSLGGTGASSTQPVAGAEQNGKLEVMLVGSNGSFYHNYQTTGSSWSGWVSIGGTFNTNTRPALGINQDGRLEAFLVGKTNGDMQRNAETSANSTTWASWTSIGGSFN